jgi:NAD-dependent DNA ligase
MTDNEYDILENYIKEKYPQNQVLKQIGAPPPTKNKVKLPYFMGSMDKIKPDTTALNTWKTKFPGPQYILSCKLDGVSGLYTTETNTPKLYTRGDGTYGQDVSHLIPYLNLPNTPNIVIRGEFIITKQIFETKYKTQFANPRNMVAGLINQKSTSITNNNSKNNNNNSKNNNNNTNKNKEILKDLSFIAYELIKPETNPSNQFKILKTQLNTNLNIVQHTIIERSSLSNELLSQTLINWRDSCPYEIDGIIVTDDSKTHTRQTEGNPEYSFAFKMVLSEQIAEAKVVNVIWTPSKDGYLKPRVQIEPIQLGGVQIEYATGFNAKFIQDNRIGVGALIELVRSGDVIPHIRKVITPATTPLMPQETTTPYKWSPNHVDIILLDIQSNEDVKEKNITGFFKGIQVDGLSSGNISRIIQHTSFNTIPKILNMTIADFLKVEGFKEKTAQKLYEGIKTKTQEANLITIMSASNIFGRGFSDKKLELILNEYPDVLLSSDPPETKIQKVESIKGMAIKTAQLFVAQIPAFLEFLQETNLTHKLTTTTQQTIQQTNQPQTPNPLFNKTIVLTGFRDQELQDQLKKLGAKQTSTVSKNTFILLVKDNMQDETSKVQDAKKLNIPIMTKEEFKIKFYL